MTCSLLSSDYLTISPILIPRNLPLAQPFFFNPRGEEITGLIVKKPNIQIFTWGLLHKYIDPECPVFDNLDLKFLRNS